MRFNALPNRWINVTAPVRADSAGVAAANEVVRHFDAVVGPAVRTALFSVLIDEPAYLCGMFATGKSALKRALYRLSFPLARPLMAKGNGVDSAESIARAFEVCAGTLDTVAERVKGTGYLVGDRFTVADLTAAALLAPLCDPAVEDMRRPAPRPPAMDDFLSRWQAHPGRDLGSSNVRFASPCGRITK